MPHRVTPSTPIAARSSAHDAPALPDAASTLAEQRPDTPSSGPAFARGLWRIAAADVSSGNSVELLHDGPATYEVMIAAIAAARESVVLESYIFRSDETGQRFATALVDAVTRGVAVRVLSDWIGMRGIRSSFVAALRRAGVELRVFNTPGFRPWFGLVPRDHRKLLVVDAMIGITGGVGIGDEWIGKTERHRGHWRDTAVRINPDVLVLCHGGPIATPEDAQYIFDHTEGIAGFFGASSIERLAVEPAIEEQARKFKRLTPRDRG